MVRALELLAVAVVLTAAGLTATWAARYLHAPDVAIHVTGSIEGTQVDVSAKMTGRIVELLVREGQRVERGQFLVRLEAPELAAGREPGRSRRRMNPRPSLRPSPTPE